MRVDEVDDRVMQALDAAVATCANCASFMAGTGALRSRVSEMLKKDTRVAGFHSVRGTKAAMA
jgi:DNA mismatch repair protein MutS2